MPLKDKTVKPNNIGEQIPPAAPTAQNLPPIIPREQPGLSHGSLGPAPAGWTTSFDSVRQWVRPGTSQNRFPPLPSKANPQINSSASSISTRVVAPVQSQVTSNTQAITALQQVTFQGAWLATTVYSAGAQVDYGGAIYSSLQSNNLNQEPDTSPTYWQATGGTSTFLGDWNNSTNYVVGNQVIDVAGGGGYYICILANVNKQPSANPSDWQLVTAGNLNSYAGAYSGAASYAVGQTVSYQGSLWVCISATTGHAPSTSSSYWTLLGSNALFMGTWSSTTAYTQNMTVVYQGNLYQAVQASTNQTPSPTSSTYWQLTGPATLDDLTSGTSNFPATASTLTYRPTTNPLTATDAGSNATVNIASFTMRTSSKGDISINSGSITALSYSTLYYIYYDDATLAGGAVTYAATTTKTTAINGSGRFFVGSIVTPAATAPNTTGNNDGGVGAQSGQTSIFLFGLTTAATTGAHTPNIANANHAIDGDLTTFAKLAFTYTAVAEAETSDLILSAGAPSSAPWQSLTLYVASAVPTNGSTAGSNYATALVRYSLDGGSSYTNIFSVTGPTTRAFTVDSISLPVNQNLALVRVEANMTRNSSSIATAELDLYEAYVVGLQ